MGTLGRFLCIKTAYKVVYLLPSVFFNSCPGYCTRLRINYSLQGAIYPLNLPITDQTLNSFSLGGVKNGGSTTWLLWSHQSCRLLGSGHCDVICLAGSVESRCMLHNGFDFFSHFDCFDATRHINQRSGQFYNVSILNSSLLFVVGNYRKIRFQK